jgi:hypothetical protein
MTIKARDIEVKVISSRDAARIIKSIHYSGKVVPNSQIHFGVFAGKRCGGAISFGVSTDKRKMAPLVAGTRINEFVELNRLALADWLPKNSESRALGVALRFLRKNYPHLKWVVSFADATQCGDGTIYRASGFVLTAIKKNASLLRMPDGAIVSTKTLNDHLSPEGRRMTKVAREQGAKPLAGFQLRYVYFLQPKCRRLLTVPEIPFSAIAESGAAMYRGVPAREA